MNDSCYSSTLRPEPSTGKDTTVGESGSQMRDYDAGDRKSGNGTDSDGRAVNKETQLFETTAET